MTVRFSTQRTVADRRSQRAGLLVSFPPFYSSVYEAPYGSLQDTTDWMSRSVQSFCDTYPERHIGVELVGHEQSTELLQKLTELGVTTIHALQSRQFASMRRLAELFALQAVALTHLEYALAPTQWLDELERVHRENDADATLAIGIPSRLLPEMYSARVLDALVSVQRTAQSVATSALCRSLAGTSLRVDDGTRLKVVSWNLPDSQPLSASERPARPIVDCKDTLGRFLESLSRHDGDTEALRYWRQSEDTERESTARSWKRVSRRRADGPKQVLLVSNASVFSGAHSAILAMLGVLDRRRFLPTLLVSRACLLSKRAEELRVEVEVVGREYTEPDASTAMRLLNVLARRRPELVHFDGLEGLVLSALAKQHGCRIIQSARLLDVRPLARQLTFVDHVIAVSRSVQESVVAVGVPRSRVSLIYDGTRTPLAEPLRSRRLGDRWGASPDDVVILVLARIEPNKRLELLVRAVGRLLEANRVRRAIRIHVAGEVVDRAYKDAIDAEATLRGVKLCWLGFVRNVEDLIAASDCVASVGRAEAAGMAILESTTSGRPVVTVSDGGCSELVLPGVSGTVAAPTPEALEEALLQVLCFDQDVVTPELLAWRRRFSAEACANDVMAVYDRYV